MEQIKSASEVCEKLRYSKPVLTEYGNVRELTKSGGSLTSETKTPFQKKTP